ncbi:hypothetical protein HDZ31DRAFT_49848 [Schizophyllum fasciatum]
MRGLSHPVGPRTPNGMQSSYASKPAQRAWPPVTPDNKGKGRADISQAPFATQEEPKVLVLVTNDDDDDDDDDYVPPKEGEEDTSDASTEEDVATEPDNDNEGAGNGQAGAMNESSAMSAPAPPLISASASTSRSLAIPGRFPIGRGYVQSPPLTGKRSSQDGPFEEDSESKRLKGDDSEMASVDAGTQQQQPSFSAVPQASGPAISANSPAPSQNGFGTSSPFPSASTASPFARAFSAPLPSGNPNNGFATFSSAQSQPASSMANTFCSPPSNQFQAHTTTPASSLAQSFAPPQPTNAFASSADAFGMSRSSPPQQASAPSAFCNAVTPMNDVSLSVSQCQPSAAPAAEQGLQLSISAFGPLSMPPATAPIEQPQRDVMQESMMLHASAYGLLKAFDDAVAAAHAPTLSASQSSSSAVSARSLARSISLPASTSRSTMAHQLVRRHPRSSISPAKSLACSFSGNRSNVLFSSMGSNQGRRLQEQPRFAESPSSAKDMWTETSQRIFAEEARLTRADDRRRAREAEALARQTAEEHERRRVEKIAEKEARREQRRRKREEREAREAEERRMAAFPVPVFMVLEEQRRKEKKRLAKEARRAAKKAAASGRESEEASTSTSSSCGEDGDSSTGGSTASEESVGSLSEGTSEVSDCELATGWGARLRSMVSWVLPQTNTEGLD